MIDILDLKLFLKVASGVFWMLVYLLIIIKGFRDKTFGMPLIALGANISWEFIYSFIYPHEIVQNIINILWFLFDVIILYQVLKYGKNDNSKISRNKFLIFGIIILCFFAVYTITIEFNDMQGKYSAFPQNLLMSILFIVMLNRRNNLSEQSIYIAVFKMLGTLFP